MTGFPPKPDLELGAYQHYKGGMYEVTDLSCDEETREWRVTYVPLYDVEPGLPDKWNRLANVFVEEIAIDGIKRKRFEKV